MLAIFTLLFMFFYSATLALVAVRAFALYLLVRLLSFPIERSAQEDAIVTTAKEQSMLIETVRGITTLRLFNRESGAARAHGRRRLDRFGQRRSRSRSASRSGRPRQRS